MPARLSFDRFRVCEFIRFRRKLSERERERERNFLCFCALATHSVVQSASQSVSSHRSSQSSAPYNRRNSRILISAQVRCVLISSGAKPLSQRAGAALRRLFSRPSSQFESAVLSAAAALHWSASCATKTAKRPTRPPMRSGEHISCAEAEAEMADEVVMASETNR